MTKTVPGQVFDHHRADFRAHLVGAALESFDHAVLIGEAPILIQFELSDDRFDLDLKTESKTR